MSKNKSLFLILFLLLAIFLPLSVLNNSFSNSFSLEERSCSKKAIKSTDPEEENLVTSNRLPSISSSLAITGNSQTYTRLTSSNSSSQIDLGTTVLLETETSTRPDFSFGDLTPPRGSVDFLDLGISIIDNDSLEETTFTTEKLSIQITPELNTTIYGFVMSVSSYYRDDVDFFLRDSLTGGAILKEGTIPGRVIKAAQQMGEMLYVPFTYCSDNTSLLLEAATDYYLFLEPTTYHDDYLTIQESSNDPDDDLVVYEWAHPYWSEVTTDIRFYFITETTTIAAAVPVDGDNKASATWTANRSGLRALLGWYEGTDYYAESYASDIREVLDKERTIIFNEIGTIDFQDPILLQATVKEEGMPMNGVNVTFYWSDDDGELWTTIDSELTDTFGNVSIQTTLDLYPGNYFLKAEVNSSLKREQPITINPEQLTWENINLTGTYNYHQNQTDFVEINTTLHVIDNDNHSVPNMTFDFWYWLDGDYEHIPHSYETNETGYCYVQYSRELGTGVFNDTHYFTPGGYEYGYIGDSSYGATIITKDLYDIFTANFTVEWNETVPLSASVSSFGEPQENVSVEFYYQLDNDWYFIAQAMTNSSGIASYLWEHVALAQGIHKFKAQTIENDFFASSEGFALIEVTATVDSDGDSLSNYLESEILGTNPFSLDTDNDQFTDGAEYSYWSQQFDQATIIANGYLLDPDSDNDQLLDGEEGNYSTDPIVADTDGDGVEDGEEISQLGTDPLKEDTDCDGLIDGQEINHQTDPLDPDTDDDSIIDGDEINLWGTDPTQEDTDADGLSDDREIDQLGTNPNKADTDADGLGDGEEIAQGTDPLERDTDGDGFNDYEELYSRGTNPNKADTDADGLEDGEEIAQGTDPNNSDTDADGLSDLKELNNYQTDPLNEDSDRDGLSDGQEVNKYHTDPLHKDSDRDSLTDYQEVIEFGSNPNKVDSDGDGLTDSQEILTYQTDPGNPDSDFDALEDFDELNDFHTDPLVNDTDQDHLTDGFEVLNGLDPLNPSDAEADLDADGLSNYQEFVHQTNLNATDTDFDGLSDFEEIVDYLTNPLNNDSDADGFLDGEEISHFGTDPLLEDTDRDGLTDWEEVNDFLTDPSNPDSDGDSLNDLDELTIYFTDPLSPDSDNDSLTDAEELNHYFTDPLNNDSDADSLLDGQEVLDYQTSPLIMDTDSDGLSDYREIMEIGTDPNCSDSDGDGFSDGEEMLAQSDPLDATDYPLSAPPSTPPETPNNTSNCPTFFAWFGIIFGSLVILSIALFVSWKVHKVRQEEVTFEHSFNRGLEEITNDIALESLSEETTEVSETD